MCLITLVHGTWAQGADWTKEASPLRCDLKKKFGDRVTIQAFNWSGRNSHRARCRAAQELRTHIRLCRETFPGYEHYLIAHSHGGNVCLYALRDDDIRQAIRGVIALSTPFILSRRRNFGKYRAASLMALITTLLTLLFIFLFGKFEYFFSHNNYFIPHILIFFLTGLASAWIASVPDSMIRTIFFRLFPTALRSRIATFARRFNLATLARSFDLAIPADGGLFVVRAPGDEASSVLMGSYLVAWAVTRLGRFLDFLYSTGDRLVRLFDGLQARVEGLQHRLISKYLIITFIFICFGMLISLYISSKVDSLYTDSIIRGTHNEYLNKINFYNNLFFNISTVCFILLFLITASDEFVAALAMVPFLVGTLLTVLSGMLLLPLILLLSLVLTPFGIDCALLAPFFELSAEASPPGLHLVYTTSQSSVVGLWHSAPYNDPEAFHAIFEWMERGNGVRSRSQWPFGS